MYPRRVAWKPHLAPAGPCKGALRISFGGGPRSYLEETISNVVSKGAFPVIAADMVGHAWITEHSSASSSPSPLSPATSWAGAAQATTVLPPQVRIRSPPDPFHNPPFSSTALLPPLPYPLASPITPSTNFPSFPQQASTSASAASS